MVETTAFVQGIACLDRAEQLLTHPGAGEPPSVESLESLRMSLEEARVLLDTAKELLKAH